MPDLNPTFPPEPPREIKPILPPKTPIIVEAPSPTHRTSTRYSKPEPPSKPPLRKWPPDPPPPFGIPGVDAKLCCIGFNPEDSMLEAVFELKSLGNSINDGFCDKGVVARAGFWLGEYNDAAETVRAPWDLQNNPETKFVGEGTLRIQNYPKRSTSINYVIHKQLTPEFAQYLHECSDSKIRLPGLYCLLVFTPYDTLEN